LSGKAVFPSWRWECWSLWEHTSPSRR